MPVAEPDRQYGCMLQLAERAITEDLEVLISKAINSTTADWAVITGVQVHSWPLTAGNGTNQEYIWPTTNYAVISGERVYASLPGCSSANMT